jgi:hypothetical protein
VRISEGFLIFASAFAERKIRSGGKMIKKRGKKWVLLSKTSGRVLGTHPTKAATERQEAAINLSKARAAGHRIPKRPAKKR